MLRICYALLFALLFTATLSAQEAKLAQQYFTDGEYAKAAVLYEQLYAANNRNSHYFDRYLESLMQEEQFAVAEKAIKKELKKKPQEVKLYVNLGDLYERQIMDDKAADAYQSAIKKMPADRFQVTRLANAFMGLTRYDLAIQSYEKGAKLLKDDQVFAYNLGDLYRRKGDTPNMIDSYLNSLATNPGRLNSLKTLFQRYLKEADYLELQTQLYQRTQQDQDAPYYPELLAWVFIQSKDYKNALRQVKALDRRLAENGARIFRLGTIALNDGDYRAAIAAFDYITEEKGTESTFYIDAKREALRAKRLQVTEGFDYTEEDLLALETEYERFLAEFGKSRVTAGILLELAELEAFYLNNLPKATALLSELVAFPGMEKSMQGEAKLMLGDFYLMQGEVWEATLLYSQVDKTFEEDLLGHEARYRNAKLSYYNGDFQWAQTQFDILKASTSKLIANDALDLSIFIMDNLGLDTTARSLELFSEADLLGFQNRFEEAFNKLDELTRTFPDHSLQDDVLYTKATIFKKQRNYTEAAALYQEIIEKYADEIKADNALFELAELYENQLADPEKAKALYEQIFLDYSGSTFAVEARKRYRALRGDEI